jgi:hypothetical protein
MRATFQLVVLKPLRRMKAQFWEMSEEDLADGSFVLQWTDVVHVRANSFAEPPESFQPLDQDPLRLAFWIAVVEACAGPAGDEKTKAVLQHLQNAAARMKVTFVFCKSDEHAEQLKWRLSSGSQFAAAHAVLRGWKRLLGVAAVCDQLKVWSGDASPDGVSRWLAREKITMPPKLVQKILSVCARMSAVDASGCMDLLEDEFGVDHGLSKITPLEHICSLTRVDKNPGLQNALLRWVLEDLVRSMISRALPSDATSQSLVTHARGAMLARRIVMYLVHKLKLPAREGDAPTPPYQCSHTCFLNFSNHKRFDESGLNSDVSDRTWFSDLLPYQLDAVPVLQMFMVPNAVVHEALADSIQQNPMISAEEALQHPRWSELVGLQELLKSREAALKKIDAAALIPVEAAPAAAVNDSSESLKGETADDNPYKEEMPEVERSLVPW